VALLWVEVDSPALRRGGSVNTNACAQKIVQLRNISTQSTNTKGSSEEHYIETALSKTHYSEGYPYIQGGGVEFVEGGTIKAGKFRRCLHGATLHATRQRVQSSASVRATSKLARLLHVGMTTVVGQLLAHLTSQHIQYVLYTVLIVTLMHFNHNPQHRF